MSRFFNGDLKPVFWFVLPMTALLVVFILIPIIGTVITSAYQDVSYLDKRFTMFDNYARMIEDGRFWQSLRFTMLFIAVSVPLEIIIGLLFALLLNRTIPLRGIMRAVVLIPWAIPAAISARAWELIYNFNFGMANYLMQHFGLSSEPINWLGTSAGAFFALVVADAWKTSPFAAIILLAGLQTIPHELHQQAQIDRAGVLRRFFAITLPLLKPALLVTLLFRTIDALRVFDVIYVLTEGGPGGATTSVSLYGYKLLLAGDFGYSSAVSVALFVVAFGLSILYARMARFSEAIA
jgi:multiple sugar transport system permease protein